MGIGHPLSSSNNMFAIAFLACLALASAGHLGHHHSAHGANYGSANSAAANHGANYDASQYANQNYGAQNAADYSSYTADKYGSSTVDSNKDHYALYKTNEHDKGNYYAADSKYSNGANNAQYGAAHGHTQDAATKHNAHGHHHGGHGHGLHGHGHGHGHSAYGVADSSKYAAAAHGNQYGSNGAYYAAADASQSGASHDRAKSTHSEVRDHEDLHTADNYGEAQAANYGSQSASNYGAAAYGSDNSGAQYGSYKADASAHGSNYHQHAAHHAHPHHHHAHAHYH